MSTRIAHTVKPDETVGTIAEQYGVPWRDVLKWNNIEADTLIGKDTPFTVLEINVPDTSPTMEEVNVPVTTPTDEYEGLAIGEGEMDIMESQAGGATDSESILAQVNEYALNGEDIDEYISDIPSGELYEMELEVTPKEQVGELTREYLTPGASAIRSKEDFKDKGALQTIADAPGLTGVVDVLSKDLDVIEREAQKYGEKEGILVKPETLIETEKPLKEEPVAKPEETPTVKGEEPPKEQVEEETGKTIQASFTADRENARTILANDAEGLKILDEILAKDEILAEGYTEMWTTHKGKKEEYTKLAEGLKKEIDDYRTKIEDIAQEKAPPVFEGANKFWAVIAAALGAGAASMTGTPNFALQIINKTIDTELEKFLKSREMRKETAERQQLNLITKRSEYFKKAENAADDALAALQGRTDIQGQTATIVGLKERIKENRIQNDRNFFVQLTANYMKQREIELAAHRAYGKMYIPGATMVDAKGEVYEFSPSQGRTDKGVEIMTAQLAQTRKALAALDEMEKLLVNPDGSINKNIWLPSAVSANRQRLNALATHLETEYKIAMNMGANYSVREVYLVGEQVPTIDSEMNEIWLGKLKNKMESFRDQIVRVYSKNWETYTSFGEARIGEPQPGRKQPKIPKAAKVRTVGGKS